MAYSRGSSSNIIVGAAALFTHNAGPLGLVASGANAGKITDAQAATDLPALTASATSYKDALTSDNAFTNIGYTSNGLELAFQPDFGEVQVDQVLDVAKLYKQGMQVSLATAFAEATLENLLLALASPDSKLSGTKSSSAGQVLDMSAGDIGDVALERGIVAVGPGTGNPATAAVTERVYTAYRALSIENVTVAAKRDEASMFEVSFRLLPEDASGSYGKIVDRTFAPA
mgnify:CR=1 FL=1